MFFHDKETPNLNTTFFNKNKDKLKKIPKTLFISGGSRNGNHLIWSLLDGNKDIPYLPGEDKFLSQIFWKNLKSPEEFINNLRTKKTSFIRKMSGLRSDKWQRIYSGKINHNIWAGKHKSTVMPLIEFPKSNNNINYPAYKEYLDMHFCNNDNFFEIWSMYLNAHKLLANKKGESHKFKFVYAKSGLRRELLYLAKNECNFICLVPIRKFETFYFSKIKSKFNNTKINIKNINEAWGHWFHKTSDYLYLKKRYPKKFYLIPYEDFADIKKREESVKKLCKLLNIKFNKINLKNTQYKKVVLPNSSFRRKVYLYEKKKDLSLNLQFPSKKLPKNYQNFYKKVEKFFYI